MIAMCSCFVQQHRRARPVPAFRPRQRSARLLGPTPLGRAASAIALHRSFLSEIAAADGFWCSASHLSLFAILEALAGL